MLKALKQRMLSDRADSELVSLLILLPLVVGILFTMIDASIYFSNRSLVQAAARDGARSVAILGGNGTSTTQTPIEKQYAQTRASLCAGLSADPSVSAAYSGASTAIECNIMRTLANNKGLVNVTVQNVSCSPSQATSISQRTACSIKWTYGSIPGSAMVLLKGSNPDGSIDMNKPGLTGQNTTVGTSESEVNLTGIALVPR